MPRDGTRRAAGAGGTGSARGGRTAAIAAVAGLTLWAWIGLGLDAGAFRRAGRALGRFVPEFWPPDVTILAPTGPWYIFWRSPVGEGLIETLQIAWLGTLLGFAISLPLALLAARNVSRRFLAWPARLAASGIRVLPSLLWAILMVMLFGFGPLAGTAAIAFYTAGYLAKLQYEAFEGVERGVLDTLRAMGATRFQVAWHGVLPAAQNVLRSQALFMLEYNVRASTVIGVVGAGGIGTLLGVYLDFLQFAKITTVILTLFVVVVAIDWLSILLRRRFTDYDGPRARWRDLFRVGPVGE